LTYIGDGGSDLGPAKRCHRVFAIRKLLERCRRDSVGCIPFETFHDIIASMEAGPHGA
jgi:2-hydroxy-3-keto-5-methylthiopentenyl-1-phosphate phosphatase